MPRQGDGSGDNAIEAGESKAFGVPKGAETDHIDRSSKAAPPPEPEGETHPTTSQGSRGVKGWTGDGKGPLDPEKPDGSK